MYAILCTPTRAPSLHAYAYRQPCKHNCVLSIYTHFPPTHFPGDQMVLCYVFSHKSIKWWKKIVSFTSLVNAYLLYLTSGNNKHTQLEFQQDVSKYLLDGYEQQRAHKTPRAPEIPLRLTETRPFLEPTDSGTCPDCRVCSDRAVGRRYQTQYRFKGCKTPLCPYPCMERYHTLKDYKIKY